MGSNHDMLSTSVRRMHVPQQGAASAGDSPTLAAVPYGLSKPLAKISSGWALQAPRADLLRNSDASM